jgi:hypothetical protein
VSLFVDTGIFGAFANPRDSHHRHATAILEQGVRGRWGRLVTSDYVFDEAVTLTLARTRSLEACHRIGDLILGTGREGRFFDLVFVSPRVFLRSWSRFVRLAARGLSFTDCTTLELMQTLRIRELASLDSDFDGLVLRRDSTRD